MGDLYIDYSVARPTVKMIKALGCVGAVRYLSDRKLSDGVTNPKDITASEAKTLLDGGLSLALVWETTASRAGAGFDAGVADAKAGAAQADALGYPATAVIFYAVDYDATVSAVMPYFKGIETVAKRPIGVYGGYDIIHGLVHGGGFPYGWQTRAWSEGEVCSKAHLYQRTFEANWDLNDVLQPFPAWSGAEETSTAPVERIPVNTGRPAAIITGGSVTTAYGVKGSTWAAGYHTGEDWNAPNDYGKPAYSAVEGNVVFASTSGGLGAGVRQACDRRGRYRRAYGTLPPLFDRRRPWDERHRRAEARARREHRQYDRSSRPRRAASQPVHLRQR